METKFYQFTQNNSGGYFKFDENVSHYVIIEAENPKHANKIAENIGIYFDGCDIGLDCSCCGDRWSELWSDEEGDSEPMIYGKPIQKFKPLFKKGDTYCIVHYLNGNKTVYKHK